MHEKQFKVLQQEELGDIFTKNKKMETEKKNELVKREMPPSFIEKLMLNSESLEQVKEVGAIIIKSGFCPDHFKANGGDPVGVVMCIEAGRQLGLTWMQALSDMYPVKGRIGIMGAGARSLIFSSGVLDKWEESTEGEYPQDNYKHIVISKRRGLPKEFRTEFSVMDAKKAGLMGKDIYQRYGKRMLMWRAIGFHATDYYGDIMKGMKTVEELNDFDVIPGAGDTFVEQPDGSKIKIEGGAKGKSEKLTTRVADKIQPDKFAPVKTEVQDAVVVPEQQETPPAEDESPFKADKGSGESMNGVKVLRDPKTNEITNMEEINWAGQNEGKPEPPAQEGKWTLKEMEAMDTKILLAKVNSDMDMMEGSETIGGKNTNKKLREIIFAWQEGKLAEHVAPYLVEEPPASGKPDPEIKPNKDFDQQRADQEADEFLGITPKPQEQKPSKVSVVNKYGLDIPEKPEGANRDFSVVKNLFNQFLGITPKLDNPRYLVLAEQMGILKQYPDREVFLKSASTSEVNLLLNNN